MKCLMGPLREGTALRWEHVGRVPPPASSDRKYYTKRNISGYSISVPCIRTVSRDIKGRYGFETSACGCTGVPAFHWYRVMSHGTTWEGTVLRWVHGVQHSKFSDGMCYSVRLTFITRVLSQLCKLPYSSSICLLHTAVTL